MPVTSETLTEATLFAEILPSILSESIPAVSPAKFISPLICDTFILPALPDMSNAEALPPPLEEALTEVKLISPTFVPFTALASFEAVTEILPLPVIVADVASFENSTATASLPATACPPLSVVESTLMEAPSDMLIEFSVPLKTTPLRLSSFREGIS